MNIKNAMTLDERQMEFVKRDYAFMVEQKMDMLIEADQLTKNFTKKQGRYPSHSRTVAAESIERIVELRWKAKQMDEDIIRLDSIRNELSGIKELRA